MRSSRLALALAGMAAAAMVAEGAAAQPKPAQGWAVERFSPAPAGAGGRSSF